MRKVLVWTLAAASATAPAAVAGAASDTDATPPVPAADGQAAQAAALAARQDAHVKRRSLIATEREKHARVRKRKARLRAQRRAAHEARAAASSASPQLQAIAACESGGDPHAIGGGGAFRGKYQFDYATWASVGGSGDPAAAPEAEQDRRAAMLLQRSGSTPWPVCGR